MTTPESIVCPYCGLRSYHPQDVREGFCGFCNWWTSDPVLGPLFPRKKKVPDA